VHVKDAVAEFCNYRIGQLVVSKEYLGIPFFRREMAVLKWIGSSKSNADIATIVRISGATVDAYARRISKKVGVSDRVSAIVKRMRLGHIR
jgi:DNA-binding CsgD family transcriptional regulator